MNAKTSASAADLDYEVVIIGAGISGLQQLYRVKQMGLSVRLFEAGDGVGGTWYWNRYPGCCLDSDSQSYAFSFSEELLQEWDWSHLFETQPELERYMNFVADRFDMRPQIQLSTEVLGGTWQEDTNSWLVRLSTGEEVTCRFLLAAVGVLSAPAHYIPDFPGFEDFKGEWHHPAHWPKEPVDFTGKRVGVIGTGSTGVQIIQTIAPLVGDLTVFQRTPTFIGPLRNAEVSPELQAEWKASYDRIFARCAETPKGFLHMGDPRRTMDVSKEERFEMYERFWARPGFEKWLSVFHDIVINPEGNAEYSEFIRDKVREVVDDPELAEKLVPAKDLPFGSRRIPLETGYFEAYNRPNVHLVDVNETPIERITPTGIRTADGEEREFDMLIFATGFDSFTGGFTRMDIRGEDGISLAEKWGEHGPVNYLSVMTAGFPNFFTLVSRLAGNYARTTEVAVKFVSEMLEYLEENGITRIVPTQLAEDEWVEHELSFLRGREMLTGQNSWFNGGNIPGKTLYPPYHQTLPKYREELAAVVERGYAGFHLAGGQPDVGPEDAFSDEASGEAGRVDNLPV